MAKKGKPAFPRAFSKDRSTHHYTDEAGHLKGYRIWARFDPGSPTPFGDNFYVYLHCQASLKSEVAEVDRAEEMESEANTGEGGRIDLSFKLTDPSIDYGFNNITESYTASDVNMEAGGGKDPAYSRVHEFRYDAEVINAANQNELTLTNNWSRKNKDGKIGSVNLHNKEDENLLGFWKGVAGTGGQILRFQTLANKSSSWLKLILDLQKKKRAQFTCSRIKRPVTLSGDTVSRIYFEEAYGSMVGLPPIDLRRLSRAGAGTVQEEAYTRDQVFNYALHLAGASAGEIVQTTTIVFNVGQEKGK